MSFKQYDYLIVGQGLAGSILAHTLIDKGLRVMVLDNHHQHSSSMVAAGMINPIIGHRLNISEGFAQYFPVAKQFYERFQKNQASKVFINLPQQRLIKNSGQFEYYKRRSLEYEYHDFLGRFRSHSAYFKKPLYGAVAISRSAALDTKGFLGQCKRKFQASNSYRAVKVDYQQVSPGENEVEYCGISAGNIIFCEGHQAVSNPWLKGLPFKLAKGEILNVDIQGAENAQILNSQIINWGNWLLLNGDPRLAKLGSNFVWDDLSLTANPQTQQKLMRSLSEHTTIGAKIINAEVGIRPSTIHRKPLIGPIQNLKNAYCFNGFGSKGCLLIPFYAELFCDHLIKQTALPKELGAVLNER